MQIKSNRKIKTYDEPIEAKILKINKNRIIRKNWHT
jgi:hypothetical protein